MEFGGCSEAKGGSLVCRKQHLNTNWEVIKLLRVTSAKISVKQVDPAVHVRSAAKCHTLISVLDTGVCDPKADCAGSSLLDFIFLPGEIQE